MAGYNTGFITGYKVPFPVLPNSLYRQTAKLLGKRGYKIPYAHHSVIMHKGRKLAILAASNIDGNTWLPIGREGRFIKDRIRVSEECQLGAELYNALSSNNNAGKNDFDQGHLISYQEILWGDEKEKQVAGKDTFYFTNCVPQHSRLNKGVWKSLEQYITKSQTDDHNLNVSVFTGPVLSKSDPFFIRQVNNEVVQIPCSFWKVIYFKGDKGLTAVGFMMSHKQLLVKDGTVSFVQPASKPLKQRLPAKALFMDFKKSTTYQVKIELISEITGLMFHLQNVHLPYQKNEAREIVYKRIEVSRRPSPGEVFVKQPLDFTLSGITF